MRIEKEKTIALFVDIQEKLAPVIHESDKVISRNVLLLSGLKALDVPAVFMRQYPKGLGDTVAPLREAMGAHTPFDKLAYSAMKDEAIRAELENRRAQGIQNVLVSGIESHICVLQTCIDLKQAGFCPVLVADCVGSRNPYDMKIGLKRAVQEGVFVTTTEAILFELCVVAGTDAFKVISKLVR